MESQTKESQTPLSAVSSTSSASSGLSTPEIKKKNRVSFRTLKLSSSKRQDSVQALETVHEIKNVEPIVEPVERSREANEYISLRSDKPLPENSSCCVPRHLHEEVMFLEDIFVAGDNDEPVLEVETYEWVPLSSHLKTSDDKDMAHMHQPSKHTDACEITLESTVLPPKYFLDKNKQSYFVLDGVHRTFYLRKVDATHVLALVSSIKAISTLDDKDFWTTNYKVSNWEDLRKRLHKLAEENEIN